MGDFGKDVGMMWKGFRRIRTVVERNPKGIGDRIWHGFGKVAIGLCKGSVTTLGLPINSVVGVVASRSVFPRNR